MKKIGGILFLVMAAYLMTACTTSNTPATNSNANANANTAAKPAAAAPTADALMALDKQANDAYAKGDASFWPNFLSDKAVDFDGATAVGKDGIIKQIGSEKCDMKSWSADEPQMAKIDNDNYVLVYKGTYDGTCTMNGKSEKVPSPVRAATLYTRNGDKWQAVWHNEVNIIDPKNPPAAPAKTDDKKPADKKADDSKAADKKAEDKPAAPAAPAKSANTDALVKQHQAGWDAFKAKDAKWFDANIGSSFTLVDPMGTVFTSKADTIKQWTETMKCDGITKTSVTDGYSVAISPTLELFHLKGNADGKCDGHPNGDIWQTTLYVKDGDAWKLAFMFEMMPGTGGM
ncbi:MAG: nuclear transport factor 2 family protein [Acidobacteria bacterium]|nr:nuclear transport factor 2 family protein [Acidobacteriota bacterium]